MFGWETLPTIIGTFAGAASAVFAGLSARSVRIQTEQANKLNLFDRRMNVWSVVRELMELYKNDFEPGGELVFIEIFFPEIYMLNIENRTQAYKNKIKEIERIRLESTVLFAGETANLISIFLSDFNIFLEMIYSRFIDGDPIVKLQTETEEEFTARCEEARKKSNARLIRIEEELNKSYSALQEHNINQLIKEQIRVYN